IVVPVMEDALDRSMALAAGMDARGYGRAGTATVGERRTTGLLMIGGLVGLCVGVYALLDRTAPRWLVLPCLVAGVLVATAGLVSAGRRVQQTRYRPDPWRVAELVAMACGIATATLVLTTSSAVAYPALDVLPQLSVPVLLAVLIAALPAFLTPPPVLDTTRRVLAKRGAT
ncbi:MAG: heparan-alpha-glucosaminide N-acetyltransferase domain-containing protein, partial [Aeromicrobium sp.]